MNKRNLYNRNDLGKSFALAVGVMLLAQLVLSLVFSPFADKETTLLPTWAFWTMQALYTLAIGSSTFIYAALTKTNVLQATAANHAPKWAHVAWGCAACAFLIALMLPVNDFVMRLIEKMGLPKPSVDLPMQIVPMILIACVLAAFSEEWLFRGTIARAMSGNKNKLAALAVSGALFALFHVNPAQTLHQFVLGAFLTLLMFRSDSVWTSALVHLFNNVVAVILSFTVQNEAFFVQNWYIFVPIGLLGFIGCVWGYLATTKSSWTSDEAPVARDTLSLTCLIAAICLCAVLWVCNLVGWL